MCTRALTHTQTHSQLPHRRSSSPTRTRLSVAVRSRRGRRRRDRTARHKGECVAAAHTGARTEAKPTADQMRVLEILKQLADAADWRGVAEQERAARAVAAAVRSWRFVSSKGQLHTHTHTHTHIFVCVWCLWCVCECGCVRIRIWGTFPRRSSITRST